ncbi:unnamed protein product [Cylindrotheca closterium]|uniref:Uncharacterized protein n=1 Tax=Cylindrotheca closterium TaxID=2856 RepID=A0AAD2G026_9STRA|nr:unnamed protein product [Cylindrotheca closterium]
MTTTRSHRHREGREQEPTSTITTRFEGTPPPSPNLNHTKDDESQGTPNPRAGTNEQQVQEGVVVTTCAGDDNDDDDDDDNIDDDDICPILDMKNKEVSSLAQQKSALRHLSTFLAKYWTQSETFKDLSALDKKELYKYVTDDDLNRNLIGAFCNYLSDAKAKGHSRDNKTLSHQTTQNYISQVCGYFVYHCPHLSEEKVNHCFGKSPFLTKCRDAMRKKISDRSKEHGIPLVVPKSGATKDDWIAIAWSCVLQGSADLAEFWSLCIALTQLASRGNEMGYLKHQHGRVVDCPDGGQHNVAAAYDVINFKQAGTSQLMHIFPHATHWELDYLFAVAYHMALTDSGSDYVFPRTSEAALKSNKDNKNDSTGVSKVWSEKFKQVLSQIEKVKEAMKASGTSSRHHTFTPNLCSHSGKKYALNEMGRTLSPIYLIFRAGWTIQNLHTLFDYLIRDAHHDVKAAKTCAGWTAKWNDEIWGGFSNFLEDLDPATTDQFDAFTKYLFRNQYDKMDTQLRHLHAFSVLRFYNDFTSFLKEADNNDAEHTFVIRVKSSLDEAGVSDEVFQKWQEDTTLAFKKRNFFGMSLKEVPEMLVNSKPLLEDFKKLIGVTRIQAERSDVLSTKFEQHSTKFEQHSTKFDEHSMKFDILGAQLDRVESKVDQLISLLTGSAVGQQQLVGGGVEENHDTNLVCNRERNNHHEPVPTSQHGISNITPVPWPDEPRKELRYDTCFKNRYSSGKLTCQATFKCWFQDQLPVAFYNMDNAARVKHRNHFSTSKTVVHMMLKHLPEYPDPKDDLDVLAERAMSGIQEYHHLDKKPSRNQMACGRSKTRTKEGVPSLFEKGDYMGATVDTPFSVSTPPDVVAFFLGRGNNPTGKKRKISDAEDADIE